MKTTLIKKEYPTNKKWEIQVLFNRKTQKIELDINISLSTFREYLENKLTLYPLYLNITYTWYLIVNPYGIVIEPYPSSKFSSAKLDIYNIMAIPYPYPTKKMLQTYINKINCAVSSWIEEEFELSGYDKEEYR